MQNQQINRLKGIVGIANKAGYIVFGADNLKQYTKKLYLVVKSDEVASFFFKSSLAVSALSLERLLIST